jgi:hypothetical protein
MGTALEDWERRCGIDRIVGLKQSLVESKHSFESLVTGEREKVSKYQMDRREHQLTSYLERFHIRHVKIGGIGHAKEAALASYGIETAADVAIGKVLAVPGFGPINSRPLIEWRDELAKKFNYDPNPNTIDQAVLGKFALKLCAKPCNCAKSLPQGPRNSGRRFMRVSKCAKIPILCFQDWKRCGLRSKRILHSLAFPYRHDRNRLGDLNRRPRSSFRSHPGAPRPVSGPLPRWGHHPVRAVEN